MSEQCNDELSGVTGCVHFCRLALGHEGQHECLCGVEWTKTPIEQHPESPVAQADATGEP